MIYHHEVLGLETATAVTLRDSRGDLRLPRAGCNGSAIMARPELPARVRVQRPWWYLPAHHAAVHRQS